MGVFAINAQKIKSAGKWMGEGEFQNQPIIFGKDDAMEMVMKAIEAYNSGDADLELSFYTDEIIYLLDYDKTGQCKNKFKIIDGKRRYDVVFKNINKNKKNNSIECEANQIRLGGYKKDEKVSDVFAASDYIKVIYSNNNNNDFIGYEAKNGSIKIIIEEIK